ncbi:unnamed protein product [Adineta ricciae]|uniref:EGF-like domain-containing protein n=1 Tax=Adineta ricciae TaxID=249248 RepID=A0A815LN11_ADIRI|nr:unnamed protein product [Adineta ricciae]CAF1408992.1 unnamed protein product [Adineta ricciae]
MSTSYTKLLVIVYLYFRGDLLVNGESCNGAVVLVGTNNVIIDKNNDKWGIRLNGKVEMNGQALTSTSNVIQLAYWNRIIYQKNQYFGWWKWVSNVWLLEMDSTIVAYLTSSTGCSSSSVSASSTSPASTTTYLSILPPIPFAPPQCNSSYVGSFCNISVNLCNTQPCENNGTCIENSSLTGGYSCRCLSNFNGSNCEYDYQICRPDTCLYNSKCIEMNLTSFFCNCSQGYTGDHCQNAINYCTNITCMDNGVCRPLLLDYKCECFSGISGRHCETIETHVIVRQYVTKSFTFITILIISIAAGFIVVLDVLKYLFRMDVTWRERQHIRYKIYRKNLDNTERRSLKNEPLDDDTTTSDDVNVDEILFDNLSPIPTQYQNDANAIESFASCFYRRYNCRPEFFAGSLQDTCDAAFSPLEIKDRRPVLVYIHHDKNDSINMICKKVFCAETIIDYLLENYLVWPWDITIEGNRKKLVQVWKEIFSTELLPDFSMERCPMFIGIKRRLASNQHWYRESQYVFEEMIEHDIVIRTDYTVLRGILYRKLFDFKDEFDKNEQDLAFDLREQRDLRWDVVLEICQYLTLNDMINTSHDSILLTLSEINMKVQLSNPSTSFINTIFRQLKSKQIASVHFDTSQFPITQISNTLVMLPNVLSLTLDNLESIKEIEQWNVFFPDLSRLSLRYTCGVNLYAFHYIFGHVSNTVEKFEIHCTQSKCKHGCNLPNLTGDIRNVTIKRFLLEIDHYTNPNSDSCRQPYQSCLWRTLIELISNMCNLRHVELVVNEAETVQLLDWQQWQRLMHCCRQLNTIVLRVKEEMEHPLVTIATIQERLRDVRHTIKFRVIFQ